MKTVLLAALISLTALCAHAAGRCDYGQPHENAPEEIRQYAFLIGDYRIEARVWKDGAWSEGFQAARWNGRYILGGMAIMDEWFDEDPASKPDTGRGVNIRMYNPETARWHLMWQHTGNKQVVELSSRIEADGKMHLDRLTHKQEPERRIWFEIYGPDRWARLDHRKSDESGEFEPKYKLEAFRVPCGK